MSEELESDQHMFRYIGGGSIHGDFIDPAAFRRRKKDGRLEEGLSVNWVEWFGKPSPEEAVQPLREVFVNKGFSVGRTSRFGLLGVGAAKAAASKYAAISVVRDKQPNDESHCLVTGYEEALNEQIAEQLHKAMQASYPTTPT